MRESAPSLLAARGVFTAGNDIADFLAVAAAGGRDGPSPPPAS